MRTYKLAKGWAIFIYISAPLFIALFSWVIIMPFVPSVNDDINPNLFWIFIPVSLAMITLMVVGILDAMKSKFVIDNEKIYTVSTFSNRQMMFNEIRGYRMIDKYIVVESNVEGRKKIKISTYFSKVSEVEVWLNDNYSDLDVVDAMQEKEEILNNDEFGFTVEDREERLSKASKAAQILNIVGILIGAWTLFFPNPYNLAILASVVFPMICVVVFKYFRGLIRIDEKSGTTSPTIFWAFFGSCMGLCLRALLDYNIFDYSNIWKPMMCIALTYIVIVVAGNKEFKFNKVEDYFKILGFLLFIIGYSYGSVVTLNSLYDTSNPEVFGSTILNKRISSGKSTTYYFELSPWNYQKEIDEVSVSKELYEKLEKNDSVNIYFMTGRFDIPYFEVTE